MGTNKTDEYNFYIKQSGEEVYLDIKDEEFDEIFKSLSNEELYVSPDLLKIMKFKLIYQII